MPRFRGPNGSFQDSPARLLVGANLAAQMSDQLAAVSIPLLIVYAMHGDASLTALFTMLVRLPWLIGSIPLGLLADSWSPSKLLRSGELARCLSAGAITLLLVTHHLPFPLIAALSLIGSFGTVAFSVAAPSVTRSIYTGDRRHHINSRIESARSIAYLAGPSIGGVIAGLFGETPSLLIATMLSATAVMFLFKLKISEPASRSGYHGAHKFRLVSGFAFTLQNRWLRPTLAVAVLYNLGWFCFMGVWFAYAEQHLGMRQWQIGVALALNGLGMVIASLAAPGLYSRYPIGKLIASGPVCGAIGAAAFFATLPYANTTMAMFGFFIIGVGPMLWTINTVSLRQEVAPDHLLGQINAVFTTATAGAGPLGALAGFLLFNVGGFQAALSFLLLCMVIQAILICRSDTASLNTLADAQTLDRPQSVVAISPIAFRAIIRKVLSK